MATALLGALTSSILPGFVAIEKLSHPEATPAELEETIDGDLKHYMRGKIGFAVDILWAIGPFKEQVDAAITQAVAAAPNAAQLLGTTPATPAQPQTGG